MPKPKVMIIGVVLLAGCPSEDATGGSDAPASTTEADSSMQTTGTSTSTSDSSATTSASSSGDDAPDESGSSSTGPVDWTTSGAGPQCFTNQDCFFNEICVDEWCVDAEAFNYEIRILELTGVSCDDGVGTAEIRWRMLLGEELVHESETAECPLGWPGDVASYTPTRQTVEWLFVEIDTLKDDLLFSVCFDAPDCGPIPVSALHDGGWTGTVDGVYYIEMEIVPSL